ncbi:MAG: dTDP-4-dehydrorhamnose reductase [Gemmatimonadales bacterium]
MITGAGGMTGAELLRQGRRKGWQCDGYTRSDLDIADAFAVQAAIESRRPDIVFNAAAFTAVDSAETERDDAMAANADGPRHIARAAKAAGVTLIHISTDYVFPGSASRPYLPSDPVGPVSVYGESKLGGENAVREESDRHLIVRTSWVFSHEGRNFVRTMLRAGDEGREVRVVNDQQGSPTSAADLAGALIIAAEALHQSAELAGIYHFSNSGITNWYEFAKAIFEIRGGKPPRISPISTAEYQTPARRPAWSALDTTSFESAFGVTPRPWRDALADTMRKLT